VLPPPLVQVRASTNFARSPAEALTAAWLRAMLGSFEAGTGLAQSRSRPDRVVVHDATPAVLVLRSVGLRIDVAAETDDATTAASTTAAPSRLTNRTRRSWHREPLPVTRASLSSGGPP
jgi:hypothetical protein